MTLPADTHAQLEGYCHGTIDPDPAWRAGQGMVAGMLGTGPRPHRQACRRRRLPASAPTRAGRAGQQPDALGYGIAWGGLFGLVAGTLRASKVRHGLVLGATVWMSSYVVLPLARLYRPILEYDARVLAGTSVTIWCTG